VDLGTAAADDIDRPWVDDLASASGYTEDLGSGMVCDGLGQIVTGRREVAGRC
jgi:hypothetical protein